MKNALIALSFRMMKKNRSRTTVTIIGVLLSVILMSAIVILVTSLAYSLVNSVVIKNGDWHIWVKNIETEQVVNIRDSGIIEADCSVVTEGYALIDNSQNELKPYIHTAKVSLSYFDMLPITVIQGRLPNNINEIIMPEHFYNEYSEIYSLGSEIDLQLGARLSVNNENYLEQNAGYLGLDGEYISDEVTSKTFKIVGISAMVESIEYSFSPGYTFVTATEDTVISNYAKIYFKLNNPKQNISKVTDYIPESSIVYNMDLLGIIGATENESLGNMITLLAIVLLVICGVAAFFLTYNSFLMTVNERNREYGLLNSIGMTNWQIIKSLLLEALFLGLIVIPIGIGFGIGIIFLSLNTIGRFIAGTSYLNIIFLLNINIFSLLAVAAVALIILIMSSLIPALKCVNKTAISTLRQSSDIKIKSEKNKKPKPEKKKSIANTGNSPLREKKGGFKHSIEFDVVSKNFKRYNKKYRYAMISLVLSMVLFIAVNLYTSYATAYVAENLIDFDYDINVNAYNNEIHQSINEYYNILSQVEGVEDSGWTSDLEAGYISINTLNVNDTIKEFFAQNDIEYLNIQFVIISDNSFNELCRDAGKNNSLYYDESQPRILTFANVYYTTEANGKYTQIEFDIFSGSSLTLDFRSMDSEQRKAYYETGNIYENSTGVNLVADKIEKKFMTMELSAYKHQGGIFFILPITMGDSFINDIPTRLQMYFKASNHNAVNAKFEQIEKERGWNLYIQDISSEYEIQKNTTATIEVFAAIFVLLISIVAIINAFNTIYSNIVSRSKEFAVLKSIGISSRSFRKMMLYESILYGGISILISLVLSFFLSWLLLISFSSDSLSYVIPYEYMIIASVTVLAVFIVGMFLSMKKIKKQNVIEMIRKDTV